MRRIYILGRDKGVKKVLHYVGIMNRGGMETLIMNLYRNINLEKFQFDFATHTEKKGDFDDEIYSKGGKIYSFPQFRKNPKVYRNTWKKFFYEHAGEYDVFHFHTNSLANIVALEEAKKAGIPIRIVHSHSTWANKGKLQWINNILHRYHQTKLPKLATDLLACSTEAAQWLYNGMNVRNLNVSLLKNGVDCEKFSFDKSIRKIVRAELGVSDNDVLVGHIGKFIPVKNHTFLLEIISAMKNENGNVHAILIGEGDLKRQIADKAKQMGIKEIVQFLGVRSDIPELLMAMDIYIMPSLYEGLPVSVVEVQATGLPVLLSDTISKEVKLKRNVKFISLNESAEKWAEKALEFYKLKRETDNDSIRNAGFDIKSTAKVYEKLISK